MPLRLSLTPASPTPLFHICCHILSFRLISYWLYAAIAIFIYLSPISFWRLFHWWFLFRHLFRLRFSLFSSFHFRYIAIFALYRAYCIFIIIIYYYIYYYIAAIISLLLISIHCHLCCQRWLFRCLIRLFSHAPFHLLFWCRLFHYISPLLDYFHWFIFFFLSFIWCLFHIDAIMLIIIILCFAIIDYLFTLLPLLMISILIMFYLRHYFHYLYCCRHYATLPLICSILLFSFRHIRLWLIAIISWLCLFSPFFDSSFRLLISFSDFHFHAIFDFIIYYLLLFISMPLILIPLFIYFISFSSIIFIFAFTHFAIMIYDFIADVIIIRHLLFHMLIIYYFISFSIFSPILLLISIIFIFFFFMLTLFIFDAAMPLIITHYWLFRWYHYYYYAIYSSPTITTSRSDWSPWISRLFFLIIGCIFHCLLFLRWFRCRRLIFFDITFGFHAAHYFIILLFIFHADILIFARLRFIIIYLLIFSLFHYFITLFIISLLILHWIIAIADIYILIRHYFIYFHYISYCHYFRYLFSLISCWYYWYLFIFDIFACLHYFHWWCFIYFIYFFHAFIILFSLTPLFS